MYRLITTSALILGVALSCLASPGVGSATAAKPTRRVAAKKGVKKPTARIAVKKGVKKSHHRHHRRRGASFGQRRHHVKHHHHHRRGMHGARRF